MCFFTKLNKKIPIKRLIKGILTPLLFCCSLSLNAQDTPPTITINVQNSTLTEIFQLLESESGFQFGYSSEIIDDKRTFSLAYSRESLENILKNLAQDAGLSFRISGSKVSIKPILKKKTVSGTVTDADTGEPLVGVSILVRGTNIGTISDIDGNYFLSVPDQNDTLIFSFVGYLTEEVAVENRNIVNLTMFFNVQTLGDLVVVGYGTQKEINVTGSVDEISGKSFENRPVPNMTQGLQGLIPNLNVSIDNGRPGKSASLNIRGNTSINGGEPLVLIDGIPGAIDRVNPHDVASVTVLKDASASAIYGARGAFGVILVTTKSGVSKDGSFTVNYGNNFGWSTSTTKTDFITTGYDWVTLNDESFERSTGNTYTGYTEDDLIEIEKRRYDKTENPERPWVVVDNRNGKDQYVYYGNFDWHNYLFHKWQPSQEHNLSIGGGSQKLNFLLSGRYYEKEGVMKINRDKFDFYSFRGKINGQLNNWLTISNNSQFNANSYSYYGHEGGEKANFNELAFHASPTYVPQNPDGSATGRTGLNSYWITPGGFAGNLLKGKSRGKDRSYELTNTFEVKARVSESFDIVGNVAYNIFVTNDYYRSVPSTYSLYPGEFEMASKISSNQLKEVARHDQYFVSNIYGTYQHNFGLQNLKIMAGYNQEKKTYKTNTETKYNLVSDDLNAFDLATGDMTVNGSASEWALTGVFMRLNYDFSDKYLLEVNGRYDGTSRFPKDDRFGLFPSFSLGWRVSEEGFFDPISNVINNLKLRASYGSLGNQQVGTYAYISSMSINTSDYIINGSKSQYTRSPDPVSASLSWEKITSSNIGLDADFLEGRLSLSADAYIRNTTDMLTKGKTLPLVFGASEPKENAADLRTNGFEVSLGWQDQLNLASDPFSYRVSVVLSDYTSEITKYDNPDNLLSDYYEGQELGEMWGYVIDGYFATDEEASNYEVDQILVNNRISRSPGEWGQLRAGDIKFHDVNGDGEISNGKNTLEDHGDLVKIGNSQPRYAFGVNMSANWNNFDLSMFFQGIGKKNWYPGPESDVFWGPYSRPYYTFIPQDFEDKVWSEENPDSYFPALRGYVALNENSELGVFNDRYLQNLAYVRLKNLTLGYTLPNSILSKIGLSKCRFNFSGENLFTLSSLDTKYIDPEQVEGNEDTRNYPFSKTYSVGLDISF